MPKPSKSMLSYPMDLLKTVHSDPRLAIPAGGAIGYAAGKYGSRMLGSLILNLAFSSKDPRMKQQIMQTLGGATGMGGIEQPAAIIGSLAGMFVAGQPRADVRHGTLNFLKSISDPKYWSKNDNFLAQRLKKQRVPKKFKSSLFDPMSQKVGSGGFIDFEKETIPVSASLSYVSADPFLDPMAKVHTEDIISGAENSTSGLISKRQLAQSAIRLGAGFAPAYAFGKTVGGILSLPSPVVGRVSKIGGLAAAILNSGIVQ